MTAPPRVLLLDDDPGDRALTIRELEREFQDIEVTVAVSQCGLNQALEDRPFDVVITECHLRWTSGISVLHAVKACSPDCPVIMLTGPGGEEVVVEGLKAGLNDYVIKSPHGLARLAAAVRVALEQGRLRREARECRARCRNFFDGIPIGLYLASPDRRFLEVNLALVEMLGYPDRASLLQVKPSRVFADAAAEEKLWLSLERRDGVVRALEGAARRRDGSTIRVRRSAGPAWSAEGRVAYYHFSVDEVSPRAGVHAAPAAESGTQADGAPCPPGSRRQGQIV